MTGEDDVRAAEHEPQDDSGHQPEVIDITDTAVERSDGSQGLPTEHDAGGDPGNDDDSDAGGDREAGAGAEHPPLAAVLESILLVTDEPVPAVTLAQVAERPTGEVEELLAALADEYAGQGRGFELRQVAGGWRLYTRADCAPFVERFVLDGQQARLTQAALETLAVIAYRQPVTRQRVSAVRGVNVDGVVRTLLARGLVTEAGQDDETGATRYRTTGLFLEKLGLQSLEDLPSLAPLLPELDEVTSDSGSG
jgi:segregation and condensation protein B